MIYLPNLIIVSVHCNYMYIYFYFMTFSFCILWCNNKSTYLCLNKYIFYLKLGMANIYY